MATQQLNTDSTTLILNGRVIADFVAGDILTIEYTNPLSTHITSSNGVTIQKRADSKEADLTINIQKYSETDTFLAQILNTSNLTILNGSCKEVYRSDTEELISNYTLESGSITTQPIDTRNNQDGNAALTYVIHFRSVTRV